METVATTVLEESPVAEMPATDVVAAEAPTAEIAEVPPLEETPTDTGADEVDAEAAPPDGQAGPLPVSKPPEPEKPKDPIQPAGPLHGPTPAKLKGPRVVRYEPLESDSLPTRRGPPPPRRPGGAGTPQPAGPDSSAPAGPGRTGPAGAARHAGGGGRAAGGGRAGVGGRLGLADCSPGSIRAASGPHIGPCGYEVDAPVLEPLQRLFGERFGLFRRAVPTRPGRDRIDLGGLVREALLDLGVPEDAVGQAAAACTRCDSGRFHSYRRDGKRAGRLVHFIAARNPAVGSERKTDIQA